MFVTNVSPGQLTKVHCWVYSLICWFLKVRQLPAEHPLRAGTEGMPVEVYRGCIQLNAHPPTWEPFWEPVVLVVHGPIGSLGMHKLWRGMVTHLTRLELPSYRFIQSGCLMGSHAACVFDELNFLHSRAKLFATYIAVPHISLPGQFSGLKFALSPNCARNHLR